MPSTYIVPVLAIVGGLQAALEFDCNIPSVFSDDICEGGVIQPYKKVYGSGSYFLLKKKNEAFKEKQKSQNPRAVDAQVESLSSEFKLYVTDNRLQSVFSKEGMITSKEQIGKYLKLLIDDAKEEFIKDCPQFNELDKSQQRQIMNVGSDGFELLKQYL